ncbi:MAG: 3-oxoacyl-ACP reductase FabG, partial [Cucumibacter sp.]
IAGALVAQGAVVTLSGTRLTKLEETAASIGGVTHIIKCELSDAAAVDQLVPQAESAMGGLDILINNAGMTRDNLFLRMKDSEWDTVIAVNLTAAFRLTRAALKGMIRQRWGRIISISSVVAVDGNPGQANYAASKAGLIGMSKALAKEVATRGITVNTIAPGFVASAMTEGLNDKQRESIVADIPMGRLGEPADIAAGAVYLASNEAAYITGQTLHINGGAVLV